MGEQTDGSSVEVLGLVIVADKGSKRGLLGERIARSRRDG